MPLPHADPAPCPGQICSQSSCLLERLQALHNVLAPASIVPLIFAARSSRSGRPTSPTNTKSPVTAAIGLSAAAPSVIRKVRCSGVCPGVCSTSMRTLPIVMRSPCFSLRCVVELILPVAVALVGQTKTGARPVRQLAGPRHKVRVDVGFGDLGDPQRFLRRLSMYCSTSRLASMTMASPVFWQPIR